MATGSPAGWRWSLLSAVALAAGVFVLLLPTFALLAAASGAWNELSKSAGAWDAVRLTLLASIISTLIVILFGTPVAFLLTRLPRGPMRDLVETCVDLPMSLPPVVVGLSLLILCGPHGWIGRWLEKWNLPVAFTFSGVVIAQAFVSAPLFVRAAQAGFAMAPVQLEKMAFSLGATPWRLFFTVALPLARSAIAAGILLAWVRAVSEFGATLMFAGSMPGLTQTLPLAVMKAMERPGGTSLALALSLVALLLSGPALFAARRLAARLEEGR